MPQVSLSINLTTRSGRLEMLNISHFGATYEERLRYVLSNLKRNKILQDKVMRLYAIYEHQINILVDALLTYQAYFIENGPVTNSVKAMHYEICHDILGDADYWKFHDIDSYIRDRLHAFQYRIHEQAVTELKEIYKEKTIPLTAAFLEMLSSDSNIECLRKIIRTSLVYTSIYYLSGFHVYADPSGKRVVHDKIDEILEELVPVLYLSEGLENETGYIVPYLQSLTGQESDHTLYVDFAIPVLRSYPLDAYADTVFVDTVNEYIDIYPTAVWYLNSLNSTLTQTIDNKFNISLSVLYFLTGKLQREIVNEKMKLRKTSERGG